MQSRGCDRETRCGRVVGRKRGDETEGRTQVHSGDAPRAVSRREGEAITYCRGGQGGMHGPSPNACRLKHPSSVSDLPFIEFPTYKAKGRNNYVKHGLVIVTCPFHFVYGSLALCSNRALSRREGPHEYLGLSYYCLHIRNLNVGAAKETLQLNHPECKPHRIGSQHRLEGFKLTEQGLTLLPTSW